MVKLYRAMVWHQGSEDPGIRVSVQADSLAEAKRKLEEQYGGGNVFDLHTEEDAGRPR